MILQPKPSATINHPVPKGLNSHVILINWYKGSACELAERVLFFEAAMSESHVFFEAGVEYCRNRFPTIEPVPKGFVPVTYKWLHVPTGKTGISEIHLIPYRHMFENLKRLTDHWSTETWQYFPKLG